jgi:hypothetical protein
MVSMSDDSWQSTLLDLLNTSPVIDGRRVDSLADTESARVWLRDHAGTEADKPDDVRVLRDRLHRVIRGNDDASTLRPYLAGVHQLPTMDKDGLRWHLDESTDWAARIVVTLGELQRSMPGRLRACDNADCNLFLLDRTRGGTARWCSMTTCGNRMKARRHHLRTKLGG